MRFSILCVFHGFCGDKAAIGQGSEVRLVDYDGGVESTLMDCQGRKISAICRIKNDGAVRIVGTQALK